MPIPMLPRYKRYRKVGCSLYRTYLVNDEKFPKRLFLTHQMYLPNLRTVVYHNI